MLIQIKVPKEIGLKQRIVEKYTYLYREYRRFYPERKDYTYHQLRKNIVDVASIVNKTIDSHDIHITTFLGVHRDSSQNIPNNHYSGYRTTAVVAGFV